MFKRIGFFLITNMAVLLAVSLVLNLLGFNGYRTADYGLDYTQLMIFCLVWGSVGSFISLMLSKTMAKKFMGVQIIDERGQYAELVRTVYQFAKQANLPKMPEVGIYNSPEVNAFATGPSKSNSLVAVSTGLLQRMDKDEVEGVLAHEVAHIANGDMVTMTLVQGIVNAFVLFFAKIAANIVANALRGNDENGKGIGTLAYIGIEIAFQIIFGIFGSIVVAFFSRAREYRADDGGARLAGREKMVKALKRLQTQFESGPVDNRAESLQAFKISNKGSGFAKLFSTHPPLASRIRALEGR